VVDLKFTETDLLELNKTIHSKGWFIVLKIFKNMEENATDRMLNLPEENNVFEQRGVVKTWRRAGKEPYDVYTKESRRKKE